eukprot:3517701-Rhodomonas_salina.2
MHALIGTPGVPTAEERPEFKAWTFTRRAEHAKERAQAKTLTSRAGTPDNWDWEDIVTEDNLCEE